MVTVFISKGLRVFILFISTVLAFYYTTICYNIAIKSRPGLIEQLKAKLQVASTMIPRPINVMEQTKQ